MFSSTEIYMYKVSWILMTSVLIFFGGGRIVWTCERSKQQYLSCQYQSHKVIAYSMLSLDYHKLSHPVIPRGQWKMLKYCKWTKGNAAVRRVEFRTTQNQHSNIRARESLLHGWRIIWDQKQWGLNMKVSKGVWYHPLQGNGLDFNSLMFPTMGFWVILKSLTNFHKMVKLYGSPGLYCTTSRFQVQCNL